MAIVYPNFIETKLDGNIDNSQTVITLLDANDLPDLDPGDWFYITLYNNSNAQYEVVQVTDVDKPNSQITCVRGYSTTIPLTHSIR